LGDEFCPPGQYQPALDQLNAAQSGAWISNWPTEFQYLMEQLKANPRIDIQNDWKLLTLLIGANNLCRACDPEFDIFDSAQQFEESLRLLLTKLRLNIPKLFVNLVSMFNISQVFTLSEKSLGCMADHGA
jgi:phospholipase B1, membrane-associated